MGEAAIKGRDAKSLVKSMGLAMAGVVASGVDVTGAGAGGVDMS